MKKYILVSALSLSLLLSPIMSGQGSASSESGNINRVTVTANTLNVRSGAGVNTPVINVLRQGEVVHVIGRTNGWYLIRTNDNRIGTIASWFTRPAGESTTPVAVEPQPEPDRPQPAPQPQPQPERPQPAPQPGPSMNENQSRMLEMVNSEREKQGLRPLLWDSDIARVAHYKAKDMVDNNYFSHTSPTYGSPFDMMRSFGIQYRTAGENLAGAPTVDRAHTGLMNSDGHRRNILSSNFTHIGIGVHNSPRYGLVFVQMFVGR